MRAQRGGGDLAAEIGRDDGLGDLGVGFAGKACDLVAAELRIGLREVQPAVGREARDQRLRKRKRRGLAACRDIFQVMRSTSRDGKRFISLP